MSFKQYKKIGPNKLRVEDYLPTSTINFDNTKNSAKSKTFTKQHYKNYKWVAGLFVLLGFSLLIWNMVPVPAPKTSPALKAAYDTLVNYVRATNGPGWNVALVGHDPCSTGISEGLRADAPWALDLWNSTVVASDGDILKLNQMHQNITAPEQMSNWDWATLIINDTSQPDIQAVANLWLKNEPFYVSDEVKANAPVEVQEAFALWDNLQVRAYINEYYVESWTQNNTEKCPPATEYQKILHTIGIVSDQDIATLKSWGYGFSYDKDWPEMQVYGLNQVCAAGLDKYFGAFVNHAVDKVADVALCDGGCALLDGIFGGPEDPAGDAEAGVCAGTCPEGIGLGLRAYETCTETMGESACPSLSKYLATNVCDKICPKKWWLPWC